jgi:hypothetical protein
MLRFGLLLLLMLFCVIFAYGVFAGAVMGAEPGFALQPVEGFVVSPAYMPPRPAPAEVRPTANIADVPIRSNEVVYTAARGACGPRGCAPAAVGGAVYGPPTANAGPVRRVGGWLFGGIRERRAARRSG